MKSEREKRKITNLSKFLEYEVLPQSTIQ